MKIFIDSANLDAIKQWHARGVIDGVTTNPSLLSKEAGQTQDIRQYLLAICQTVAPGPVSIEVTEKDAQAVYEQARTIAALAPNAVVKIPCHVDYYGIIKKLVDEGVALNITLVFSVAQGLLMSKLGVAYISPFVGRLDDIQEDGMALIRDLCDLRMIHGFKTEILAASLRHVAHVQDAALSGADIGTVPADVLMQMTKHALTDQGIAKFDADWQKMGISQFP